MGNLASRDALIARWEEVCRDPSLQDLPYKIELNAWGKVEMSPASVRHGWLQAAVAGELTRLLPEGITLTECPILTSIGVRVPDVAWASAQFMKQHGTASPLPCAPEICVEVLSPSNVEGEITEKTRAYLAAGAAEVWIVAENGTVRFNDLSGEKAQSRFAGAMTLPDPTKGYP